MTSVVDTVLDVAATTPFLLAVALSDTALWKRRAGGPLITHEDLLDAAWSRRGRGSNRARSVVQFSKPGADSPRESQSRVLISRMGFPDPELQHRFILGNGRAFESDFWWPRHEHIGEFDGKGKYVSPLLLRGRTPAQAVIEEKDREDELRRYVRGFSRWRTPALEDPRQLYDILARAGLPTRMPRPTR